VINRVIAFSAANKFLVLILTVVALVGAALPAWRANRADPVLALREG